MFLNPPTFGEEQKTGDLSQREYNNLKKRPSVGFNDIDIIKSG